MKTCIYYEQETVSADDARRARALAGAYIGESTPAGTIWAEDIGGEQPEREPNSRSGVYLDDLMPWLDRLGKTMEASVAEVAWRQGASLAEIARYELLFDLAAANQRWQVVSNICRRWRPDRLLWITTRAKFDRELTALSRAVRAVRVEVHCAREPKRGSWKSAWDSFKTVVGPPVKRAGWMARSALRRPNGLHALPEVVFTEHFPNSVSSSIAVAKRLQSEYGVRVLWLATRQKVANALRAKGVESLVLPNLLSARTHYRGRLTGRQQGFVKAALRNLPDAMFYGTADLDGREYFLTVLEPRVTAAWSSAAYWIEAYDEVFAALRPAAVVSTTYSSCVGRAAAFATRRHGGRAVYLQHGLFPDRAVYSFFCHDLLLMWGQYNLRSLSRCGVDPQSIQVTGATLYDDLFQRRATYARGRPCPGDPFKVAYMASRTGGAMVSHTEAKTCLLAVADAVRRVDGAHLTVKVHPGDHTGLVPQVMQQFPQFTIVPDGSSQEVILASDMVIVVSSTTGFEACVADKPLVVLAVVDDPESVPYVDYGAALKVSVTGPDPAAELTRVIRDLRDDPSRVSSLADGRARLLDDMLNGSIGGATDQAAAAVADLIGRRATEPVPHASDKGRTCL